MSLSVAPASAHSVRDLPRTLTPAFLSTLTGLASAAKDADSTTATAPYTGEPLAQLPVATPEAVAGAFARAR
ncbi:MAG: hypothetical protein WBP48_18065, partial [Microbacterium sp.]